MAFPDDFVQCMSQSGITIDPNNVDDVSALQQAASDLQRWYQQLADPASVDAITRDDPVNSQLGSSDVGATMASVPKLLAAFDAAPGVTIGQAIQALTQCVNTLQS